MTEFRVCVDQRIARVSSIDLEMADLLDGDCGYGVADTLCSAQLLLSGSRQHRPVWGFMHSTRRLVAIGCVMYKRENGTHQRLWVGPCLGLIHSCAESGHLVVSVAM